jgi:hypothetical protein
MGVERVRKKKRGKGKKGISVLPIQVVMQEARERGDVMMMMMVECVL